MKILKFNISAFLLFFFLMTASCGYQFEGGGYLKDTFAMVAVKVFENQSNEIGADLVFTNELIREIIGKTDTKVVDEDQADAVLKGSVKSITFTTLSRSTAETVSERRVSATVDLQLVDKEGEIIWSVKDLVTTKDYEVSENQLTDDSNKKEAVEKVALRTSERLVTKLVVDF